MVTANIFISQSWEYANRQALLIDLLNESSIIYDDYCVPWEDPVGHAGNVSALRAKIERQIRDCSCVLMLYGTCWRYSRWVHLEMEAAKKFDKPIIAVKFPDIDPVYDCVKTFATTIVDWDSDTVIAAIKEYDENYSRAH